MHINFISHKNLIVQVPVCFALFFFFFFTETFIYYTHHSNYCDNMNDRKTSMQIHESTLNVLHSLKGRSETYEDVIRMLLLEHDDSITFDSYK